MTDLNRFDVSQDPLEALHLSPGMLELMDGAHKTWYSEMQQSDIETKPSSLYTHSSLEELRRFVKNRQIPFKYTHAQSYTRKSHAKKEKAERRKLEAALYKADAAATFRFHDLPLELREHVYDHFFDRSRQPREPIASRAPQASATHITTIPGRSRLSV
jgi:hypothetical protein